MPASPNTHPARRSRGRVVAMALTLVALVGLFLGLGLRSPGEIEPRGAGQAPTTPQSEEAPENPAALSSANPSPGQSPEGPVSTSSARPALPSEIPRTPDEREVLRAELSAYVALERKFALEVERLMGDGTAVIPPRECSQGRALTEEAVATLGQGTYAALGGGVLDAAADVFGECLRGHGIAATGDPNDPANQAAHEDAFREQERARNSVDGWVSAQREFSVAAQEALQVLRSP